MDRIKQFEPLFGRWYAESRIGEGSFGRVYRIYRDELDVRFYSALKHVSIPSDPSEISQHRMNGLDDGSISTYYGEMVKDIQSEITIMNKLRGHTNIVNFEDSIILQKPGGIGYDVFIRMELLTPLSKQMAAGACLPSGDNVSRLGIDICRALIVCCKYDVIHRDIKPENIFITKTGDYKLGDFGIARSLEKSISHMSKKGTPNYMAPEVWKGEKYNSTCDIYSLGIVMYRILNRGRLPFLPTSGGISPRDIESAFVRRMRGDLFPAPCDADTALSKIVLKACAFDPRNRFSSAENMKEALECYKRGDTAKLNQLLTGKAGSSKGGKAKNISIATLIIGAVCALALTFGIMALLRVFSIKPNGAKTVQTVTPEALMTPNAKPTDAATPAPVFAAITASPSNSPTPTPTAAPTPTPAPTPTHMPTPEPTPYDYVVRFHNSAFENALRNKYNLRGEIFYSTIKRFNELNLSNAGLTDISDIAMFTELTKLDLNENRITNLEPLRELKKLRYLSLHSNYEKARPDLTLSNIDALRELTDLEELYLHVNGISDIGALANLKKLRVLALGNNRISNIDVLSNLKNLEKLLLQSNSITDISALKELPLTNISLQRSKSKILNLSILGDIKTLKDLDLSDMQAQQLTNSDLNDFLNKLVNLENLYLMRNSMVTTLPRLEKLKSLKRVCICRSGIRIETLAEFIKEHPNVIDTTHDLEDN